MQLFSFKYLMMYAARIISKYGLIFKNSILNNIYACKSGSYLAGNTLRLRYKAQLVNAVWKNSRCLLCERERERENFWGGRVVRDTTNIIGGSEVTVAV
jgi:aminopeptidase C